ncbi:DUF6153 family protein [Klenkia taihuensis]|uniref:MYXO-CTERM domain-containing protein n=1 Tax=Klenkia taihuensis TaxID=1225127 RepID=A0A1I1N7D4_9ACTN|nr:DUF6153 family protein [Klenkia taihuensis]GHE12158.1 hypothetical protein GCM10011381_28830 [Klenkia taihuensis]SFC93601.1 hypothetical protein SAMN05661030_2005 [Klenkia taihuensis]
MRYRLGWALLLLAAVFSMHGLQCAAAEPTSTSTASAEHAVVGDHASLGSMDTGVAGAPAHGAEHHDPAGHSAALHALMVCLAVLAGGVGVLLAALAVWLARRRARAAPAAVLRAVHRAADRLRALAAPPDLARLCVLRI